jgi:hypothetical protein
MADEDEALKGEFKAQTPQTYKWATGAAGIVAAAVAAASAIKPETAGYSLAALVLFVLAVFIVISVEAGTTANVQTNPTAKNAQLQVFVLSWFATIAFILGAGALISSMLLQWPLNLSLVEDKSSQKFLDSIKQYDSPYRVVERAGSRKWQERALEDGSIVFSFFELQFDSEFLLLSDDKRGIKIRIPTQGGLMQWSLNEKFDNCSEEYCWGDVREMRLRRN